MYKSALKAIVILFLLFFAQPVSSVELLPEYEKGVMTITDDFNGDGGEETVTLGLKDDPNDKGNTEYILTIKSKQQKHMANGVIPMTSSELSGVEKIVVSAKKNPFIGVSYHCGAHSGGLQLYSFDGKSLKKVTEFGSDGPSIRLWDVDKDGENEIVTESCDWDHNPVQDRIIETYKYDGKKWNLISVYETRIAEEVPKIYFGEDRLHNGFMLTYVDFIKMSPPAQFFYIDEYLQILVKRSKGTINMDHVLMRDVETFINDYGKKHGKDVRMTEVIEKMVEKLKRISI